MIGKIPRKQDVDAIAGLLALAKEDPKFAQSIEMLADQTAKHDEARTALVEEREAHTKAAKREENAARRAETARKKVAEERETLKADQAVHGAKAAQLRTDRDDFEEKVTKASADVQERELAADEVAIKLAKDLKELDAAQERVKAKEADLDRRLRAAKQFVKEQAA
jgi:chromosome segregation ATPase